MPRNLPWVTEAATTKKRAADARYQHTPKRDRVATPADLVDGDLNTTGVVTPERRKALKPARSPSTSPPPAPPDVDFMQEGFDADDVWMMVEDEFYATAQKFTQHIHRAEYDRLRKLARSRGDRTLRALERATDGRTEQSVGLRMRLEAEERGRKIQSEVRREVGDESEEEDAYMLDANLASLMTGSQAVEHDLTSIVKARSNTRAAAGFDASPRKPRLSQVRSRDREVKQKSRGAESPTPGVASRDVLHEDAETETDGDDLDAVVEKVKILTRDLSTTRDQTYQREFSGGDNGHEACSRSISVSKPSANHRMENVSPVERGTGPATGQTPTVKRTISNILSSSSDEDDRMSRYGRHAADNSYVRRHEKSDKKQKPHSDAISVPMWL